MAISKANLAKIHIAKKELGLSDEAYRDILGLHFQVQSARKLTDRQATVLLHRFQDQGWKPKGSKKKSTSPKYTNGQMRKVVAIWITMYQNGLVRSGSDQSMQAYVKRMTGVDNLKWCLAADLNKLIEALKKYCSRNGVAVD